MYYDFAGSVYPHCLWQPHYQLKRRLWQAGGVKVAKESLWAEWIMYSGWLQLVEPVLLRTLLSWVSSMLAP